MTEWYIFVCPHLHLSLIIRSAPVVPARLGWDQTPHLRRFEFVSGALALRWLDRGIEHLAEKLQAPRSYLPPSPIDHVSCINDELISGVAQVP